MPIGGLTQKIKYHICYKKRKEAYKIVLCILFKLPAQDSIDKPYAAQGKASEGYDKIDYTDPVSHSPTPLSGRNVGILNWQLIPVCLQIVCGGQYIILSTKPLYET